MHLGLYARARKDLLAKEREYAKILARRAEKAARSVDGDEADEQIYFRSPSQSPSPSPTNGRPRSHSPTPGSAPRASSKSPTAHGKPSSPSKAAQKLHEAVGRADTAGARIEYQAAAVQHDLRASAEGGWNSSTNDNILNSSHNPGRPHSAYDARRAYAPAFNKVLDSVAKSKEDGGAAAKVRPKSSTGIGRADPKKVATQTAQPKPERHEHKQDKQEKAERMEKLAKSTEFAQSAAATERPASPKKHEFTLYDVKEKTREFFHYPAGSFRNTGDLIDFQALAVQQSVKQGNTKPRAQSAHHAASKPIGVFPGVENGPEWVKFPKSEELTRSYSESKGLTSPGRSRSMKKLSAMRKNVSFGAQSNAAKEVTAERTPSPVALQRALTGQISPKNISPRPLSRNRSENKPEELKFDASEFVEAGIMLERATSQVPFSGRRSPPFDGTGTATPASMQDGSYLSADPEEEEEEKEPVEESEASVSSEEPENDVNHAIRGLHVKSHSGLDTRSSSIFNKVEIAPRLVGNSVEDILSLGGTCYVPDIFEVSVFDVGYVLPCSNNTILFSAKQSAENAQILTQKERMRMRSSFVGLSPAVLGASAKHNSSKNKPAKLVKTSESQVPGESLSIKMQSADVPYLPTTYGILVEVIAKPQIGASSSAPSSPHPAGQLGKSTSSDHESHASSLHYHHHHHRHNPATYTYKLIPLRELLDIALAANNDDMCTLLHEMLHFGYKFGQMNNAKAENPIQQARLLHRSQCEMMGDKPPPDHILFNDQVDVVIYPCMFNMLDRHVKRSLSMLIKNNLEVLFSTDLQRVSIGIKY